MPPIPGLGILDLMQSQQNMQPATLDDPGMLGINQQMDPLQLILMLMLQQQDQQGAALGSGVPGVGGLASSFSSHFGGLSKKQGGGGGKKGGGGPGL